MAKTSPFRRLSSWLAPWFASQNMPRLYFLPALLMLLIVSALSIYFWLAGQRAEQRSAHLKAEVEAQTQLLAAYRASWQLDSLLLQGDSALAEQRELSLQEKWPSQFLQEWQRKKTWWQRYQNEIKAIIDDSLALERQLRNLEAQKENIVAEGTQTLSSLYSRVDSLQRLLRKSAQEKDALERSLEAKSEQSFLSFYSSKGVRVYYIGESQAGKAQGQGVGVWKTGSKYEGQWQQNRRHGQGHFEWPEGDRYEGDFQNDKRHGQGTYYWLNGDKYVGGWENDRRSGQGSFYNRNGELVAKGRWAADELVERSK